MSIFFRRPHVLPVLVVASFFVSCSTEDRPVASGTTQNLNMTAPSSAEAHAEAEVKPGTYYETPEGAMAVPQTGGFPTSEFSCTTEESHHPFCSTLVAIHSWYNAKAQSRLFIPFGKADCAVQKDRRLACGDDVLDPSEWVDEQPNGSLFRAPSGSYSFSTSEYKYLTVRRYTNPKTLQVVYSNTSTSTKIFADAGFTDMKIAPFKLLTIEKSISAITTLSFIFWKSGTQGVEWISSPVMSTCVVEDNQIQTLGDCTKPGIETIGGLVGYAFDQKNPTNTASDKVDQTNPDDVL